MVHLALADQLTGALLLASDGDALALLLRGRMGIVVVFHEAHACKDVENH